MTIMSLAQRAPRTARQLSSVAIALVLLGATAQTVAAAPPSNDLVSGATPLSLDVPVEFDSVEATMSPSDPTDCDGSHGPWPGPYFASVWFSYTATSTGQLNLSAPTMQGTDEDFLAISFVSRQSGANLTLIDCTAFGNDASWPARKGGRSSSWKPGCHPT